MNNENHYWNDKVKRLLKSELVKRGINTEELAHLLNMRNIKETKSSIDSKISRGSFSAAFFIQCLTVINCSKIEIEDYKIELESNTNNTSDNNGK